ncbi:MAG: TIGR00730 family Rossman fold protein [Neisseriaceae bacterium]|nr:TIGR00730 family Rossman fold protein [Neisseriaceae bacterium]
MHTINSITLFCGSNLGNHPEYEQKAKELGHYLAQNKIKLIFGGGRIGLMGATSQAVIDEGGDILGIIPEFLQGQEMGYEKLIEMQVVPNMAIRKDKMIELADGFIVLPGGIGTYEEVFEVLSRLQLRQLEKPIGFLNINHFFDSFVDLMQTMSDAGFIPKENMQLFCINENIDDLVQAMRNFKMPDFNKRMNTGL